MKFFLSDLLEYSRFYILAFAILVLVIGHTINGQWAGDFWEHSAVVRELTSHPFSPKHPQLAVDAPHAFFSPYTLVVALTARSMKWDPVTALSVFGITNFLLLLAGLRLFISTLFPKNRSATLFYSLLFITMLWGKDAWEYSGFFHLKVLGYVLPYPSTFSMALTFITLPIYMLF